MPDPGDTAAGDRGQGTSSSSGLGNNTSSGGSTYGGGGGRDSGAGGGGGMGGNYGGSTEGSRQGGGGSGGGVSGIGGSGVGGSTEGSRQGGGGNTTTSASTASAATPGGNQPSGGVSGIASSGSSFSGPGVSGLNAPATATSAQAYSNYNAPSANPPGGIASLGNQTQNTAFGGFQGPGVSGLNAPVTSSSGVPNNLGPRATSPQYTNAPTAGLGSYVSPPKQFTDRVPTTYNDLGVAGVPGGMDQRFQYNQPTGTGIPADSGPYQGGYGNFDPDSQAYAVDRGLIGSQNFAENYTPPAAPSYNPLSSVSVPVQQPSVSTVGANSPFADQTVQAYNPVQSFQNYVVPAAQALAGTPAGMNFTPNYPGQIAYETGLQNAPIAEPDNLVGDQNMRYYGNQNMVQSPYTSTPANTTEIAKNNQGIVAGPGNMSVVGGMGSVAFSSLGAAPPPGYTTEIAKNNQGVVAAPGNMSVVGGQGSVAFDSLGAAPPGYGNAVAIAQPSYNPLSSVSAPTYAAPTISDNGFDPDSDYQYPEGTVVVDGPETVPGLDTVSDNTVPPQYDYTGTDVLPDPTAPTDQYVAPIFPGQEYQPGTNPVDWAGRGNDNNQYAYNQPTTPTTPTQEPEPEDPDKDGLGWMKYYPNQYASQSQSVTLPELTYIRDPVSTGVGSLLPNIRVTPYRTI